MKSDSMERSLPILFEDFDPKSGFAYGHSGNYLLVKVPSSTKPLHGEIRDVVYSPSTQAD
jgi:hypothetical protein